MHQKMAPLNVLLVMLLCFIIHSGDSWKISILPDSLYTDAEANCSSVDSSVLVPMTMVEGNFTTLIEMLDVNDTAWIGGEKYSIGCKNDSDTENRVCHDLNHHWFPDYFLLNFSCVTNQGDQVVHSSDVSKNFTSASNECRDLGGMLPGLDGDNRWYKLPKQVQQSDRGYQWFSTVETTILENKLVRKCQYVTKTTACSLEIEYSECDNINRKGLCLTEENVEFKSSLQFVDFKENQAKGKREISDDNLCFLPSTLQTMDTTERMMETTETEIGTTTEFISELQTTITDMDTTVKVDVSTSKRVVDTVTSKDIPVEPRENTPAGSNNLWVIAVVFVFLLLIIIVVIVVWRKRRSMTEMTVVREKVKHTSISDVSAPVTGSLRRYNDSSIRPFGTDSGIEVLGRGGLQIESIDITDLDDEVNQPESYPQDSIRSISLKSTNDDLAHLVQNDVYHKNEPLSTNNKSDTGVELSSEAESTLVPNENDTDDKLGLMYQDSGNDETTL